MAAMRAPCTGPYGSDFPECRERKAWVMLNTERNSHCEAEELLVAEGYCPDTSGKEPAPAPGGGIGGECSGPYPNHPECQERKVWVMANTDLKSECLAEAFLVSEGYCPSRFNPIPEYPAPPPPAASAPPAASECSGSSPAGPTFEQVVSWAATLSGPGEDHVAACHSDDRGGLLVGGYINQTPLVNGTQTTLETSLGEPSVITSKGIRDGILARFPAALDNPDWMVQLGTAEEESAVRSVIYDESFKHYLYTRTTHKPGLGWETHAVAVSKDGEVLWESPPLAVSGRLSIGYIPVLGTIMVFGTSGTSGQAGDWDADLASGTKAVLLLLSADDGRPVWGEEFGGPDGSMLGTGLSIHRGTNYAYITGQFAGTVRMGESGVELTTPAPAESGGSAYVAALQCMRGSPSQCTVSWALGLSGAGTTASAITETGGGLLVGGHFIGSLTYMKMSGSGSSMDSTEETLLVASGLRGSGQSEGFILRMDSSGLLDYTMRLSGVTTCESVAPDAARGAYITGTFQGTTVMGSFALTSEGGEDVFAAHLGCTGDIKWAARYGGKAYEGQTHVVADGRGGAFLCGHSLGDMIYGGFSFPYRGWVDGFVLHIAAASSLAPIADNIAAPTAAAAAPGGAGDDGGSKETIFEQPWFWGAIIGTVVGVLAVVVAFKTMMAQAQRLMREANVRRVLLAAERVDLPAGARDLDIELSHHAFGNANDTPRTDDTAMRTSCQVEDDDFRPWPLNLGASSSHAYPMPAGGMASGGSWWSSDSQFTPPHASIYPQELTGTCPSKPDDPDDVSVFNGEVSTCCICLDQPMTRPTILIPCGHGMCLACVEDLCRRRDYQCPRCRKLFQSHQRAYM